MPHCRPRPASLPRLPVLTPLVLMLGFVAMACAATPADKTTANATGATRTTSQVARVSPGPDERVSTTTAPGGSGLDSVLPDSVPGYDYEEPAEDPQLAAVGSIDDVAVRVLVPEDGTSLRPVLAVFAVGTGTSLGDKEALQRVVGGPGSRRQRLAGEEVTIVDDPADTDGCTVMWFRDERTVVVVARASCTVLLPVMEAVISPG